MGESHSEVSRGSCRNAHRVSRAMATTLGCAALGAVSHCQAFTIEHAEARYEDQQYQFELVATIEAPVERVQAVLRDYVHYSSLDTRILDSKVLERPAQDVAILATTPCVPVLAPFVATSSVWSESRKHRWP
jgi:hypothetical protein